MTKVCKYGALAIGLWPFGCAPEADYMPMTTIQDARSGYYVELGQLDSMSSHGYIVSVFKDAGPRKEYSLDWNTVVNVAGIEKEPPKFYFEGGCYILEVDYGYGGLISPVWKDQNSFNTICFDLLPDRGPKGGFTP